MPSIDRAAATTAPPPRGALLIEEEARAAYGVFSVPGPVWRNLQPLGAWVEPVLVAEWADLVGEWSTGLGRTLGLEAAQSALTWLEAAAALLVSPGADPATFFDALGWRRLRLRQDQQVAEWTPVAAAGQGRAAP